MYLARHRVKGKIKYTIRESYENDAGLRSRDLFELGSDPSKYIVYPGGNAFYVDEALEEQLLDAGLQSDPQAIEDIFWPFVDPEIKRIIEPFRNRSKKRSKKEPLDPDRATKIKAGVHVFDKRRLHFLRFGQMDQGYIGRMPAAILKRVAGKSRDEIEQDFIVQEHSLAPFEFKNYVYVIFDLQRFFKELIAKELPQGLDQKTVDLHLIEEVCRLNQSPEFWNGRPPQEELHEYLRRYVVWFFDYEYGHSTFPEDYIKDFLNRHRRYGPPKPKETVSIDEARKIFGVKEETLQNMTIRGLRRLYRRQAQKLHPDTGGDHEKFIKLTDAYKSLLAAKVAETKTRL
ncbi:MAG: J domain-containing protein [Deltaproteobacteria bacterium]|nr:J domain-containing protein [Deltaproteobacteria bacterium]